MSINHTPNYNLSQWEAADKVRRTDFNADNAKIDAALKAEADARAAETKSLSDQLPYFGNCSIRMDKLPGLGTYGQANKQVSLRCT